MVSRVIGAIAIACISLLVSVFGEPPVKLNDRHLRALSEDQLRLQHQQQDDASRYGWEDSVPGVPGKDYPNLTSIPETSFNCAGKTAGGYYADVETRCQVFHVCSTQGLKSSFLCPSGSIFNQRHFVCDWWYDFICEQALELYSLNDALNDPNSSTDSTTTTTTTTSNDGDRYNQLPLAPVQFNSIGGAGSNADLSLASSGYTNNLRDEANLIYEDYSNGKITEKPAATSSGIPDNYSDARRKESAALRSYEEQQHRQTPIYRRRPSQGPDNVPRGFAKSPTSGDDGSREFKRGDQGPGFFVNNGLSDNFKDQNYQLAGENNNFIDNSNYYRANVNDNFDYNNRNANYNNNNYNNKAINNENNNFNTRNSANNNQNYNTKVTSGESTNFNVRNEAIDNANYNSKVTTSESTNFNSRNMAINSNDYKSQVTTSESTNFNTRNTANNNGNIVYSDNNNSNNLNDYQNFYQNSVQYPLPQENNNYDNNFNQNFVNTESQNDNYYNAIRIYSSEYTNKYNDNSSSSFSNSLNYNNNRNNFEAASYNTDNNYNNNNNHNFNSNGNYNEDNNSNRNTNNDNNYENKFESDYRKPIHVEPTTLDYNFQNDQYETTITPDFLINANPSEEEVDRQRQREVDSVDLKRQRPPPYTRQYTDTYTSPPGFLIREETSWRDDLSTSSSGSQSPPFPPEQSTPTLPRPEETTTPLTIPITRRSKESPRFLGRRPSGGLPGGTGNGLPGANKNLAASNAITGKPNDDETSTNSISRVDDTGYSTYRPPQGFTVANNEASYRTEGQYNWNDGREWNNDGARYNQRY